eukprot:CAMPEP_0180480548 /NCGR_PEP_ID=MMETSP1036_2-20121128/33888_1 /TAXON_ID=632150 /ORGANISM="Azadinium spinosum, Strain 3D9" /LENGTH=58 /DNA_ID=CAMNT_0022488177 /DNA_START=396 /DNA_END=573 /DNA_ORIENTATION=-
MAVALMGLVLCLRQGDIRVEAYLPSAPAGNTAAAIKNQHNLVVKAAVPLQRAMTGAAT